MNQEKKVEQKKFNGRIMRIGFAAFLVLAAVILLFFLIFRIEEIKTGFSNLMSILSPIIMGFVVAYLINPIMKFFDKMFTSLFGKKTKLKHPEKLSRGLSIFLAVTIFVAAIAALIWMVVPSLVDSIVSLANTLPNHIDKGAAWVKDFLEKNEQLSGVLTAFLDFEKNFSEKEFMDTVTSWAGYAVNGVVKTAYFVWHFFLSIIVAVYLLARKESFKGQFKKVLYAFTKRKTADTTLAVIGKSNEIFIGYIYGQIVSSIVIGILCFIGVSIFKMPYAVLISVFVGVTNVIPVFGPYIGAIPTTLLILLVDPIKAIYFVIFIIVLQAFEGNIIAPKILGDYTGLSPFWVIFAIVVCGGLFGMGGMLIGVPVFAVIYYMFSEVVKHKLAKKKLPTDTNEYIKDGAIAESIPNNQE